MLEWPSIWLTLSRLIPFPSAVFSQYIGSRPQNLDLERLKTKRSLARLSALPFRETSMLKVDNGNMVSVIYTPSSGATRKFQGPLVPSKVAGFYKKSNPE